MRIDVSAIEKEDGASLAFDIEEELKCLNDIREDCKFLEPVSFKGVITNNKGILRLKGKLKTEYSTVCCRCMKPLARTVDIEIKEEVVNLDSTESSVGDSVYTFSGNYFFMDRMVLDNTTLSLPMREICSPDCKGLCSKCGKDLNKGTCGCTEDSLDIRLDALKNYFDA